MDILQLNKNAPYPPTNGAEVRTWKTTERFVEIGRVWLACPWDGEDAPREGITVLPVNSPVLARKRIRNDLWYGGFLFKTHPVMPVLTNRVTAAVQEVDTSFDVVVSESPQLVDAARQIAHEHSSLLLLNKHNAYYRYFDQYLADTPLPATLRRRTVENMRQYEQRGVDAADVVVFQSEADREAFDVPPEVVAEVIPNGTDVERVRNAVDPDGLVADLGLNASAPVCVFLGSYDYDPNHAAARTIIDEIAPALPDVEFLLVGRNPPETDLENVYTPGFVDNLADAFHVSDVALCPLPRGSGTKLKMLDYLAAGLPIVTTTVGIQGLPVDDRVHALVRDEPAEMIEAIRTLLDSPARWEELSTNARRLGERYDWEKLLERYAPLIEERAAEGPQPRPR
jgi:glycosyltransferase involved in cell wall biosynthesis